MQHQLTGAERRDVDAGIHQWRRYGATFLKAYNAERVYASHRVGLQAAHQACMAHPGERARRNRIALREDKTFMRSDAFTLLPRSSQRRVSRAAHDAKRAIDNTKPEGTNGRPVVRTRQPRAQASRSSAKSGDSGDDGPQSDEAPATAQEAVAVVWEEILRRRHPVASWRVLVADVWNRTTEAEIAAERDAGLVR